MAVPKEENDKMLDIQRKQEAVVGEINLYSYQKIVILIILICKKLYFAILCGARRRLSS